MSDQMIPSVEREVELEKNKKITLIDDSVFPECEKMHWITCWEKALSQFGRMMKATLLMYAPIHFIPSLIFKIHKLHTLKQVVMDFLLPGCMNTVRSALFLSLYGGIFSIALCKMRMVRRQDDGLNPFIGGVACATSILAEKKSRRPELAIYVVPHAAEVMWNVGKRKGWWRGVEYGEVLLFCFAMGVMMYCFEHEPRNIRSTFVKLIGALFGKPLSASGSRAIAKV